MLSFTKGIPPNFLLLRPGFACLYLQVIFDFSLKLVIMRRLLLAIFFLQAGFSIAHAQIFNPVSWDFSQEQLSEDTWKLTFQATIDNGWSVYSQYLESDDGPIPTSFTFEEGAHFEMVGKTEESGKKKSEFDKIFEMELVKFTEKGIFTQVVKVNDSTVPISGYLTFMTCDDTRCLPPKDIDFSFTLQTSQEPEKKAGGKEEKVSEGVKSDEKSEDAQSSGSVFDKVLRAEEVKGNAPAGQLNPVAWAIEVRKVGASVYELELQAEIEAGWNIYSKDLDVEIGEGPAPTEVFFNETKSVELVGAMSEQSGKAVREYDSNFEMELIKLKESVTYTQRLKVNDPASEISGGVYFMSCDATRCLPPKEVPFSFTIAEGEILIGDQQQGIDDGTIIGFSNVEGIASGASGNEDGRARFASLIKESKEPAGSCEAIVSEEASKSLWNIFALGFIGGLIALLTPCVFPMIPLTVSFFTKSSGSRGKGMVNATLYGAFILLVYLLLSVPFHLLDSVNPNILNDISTNVWLNIGFFAIFIFFAFSFFGYYELTLPSSWSNKASSAEGIGGIIGIFFMALTLALVSFSCTGPILGSLLAGAVTAEGGAMQLTSGMGGFGLALALPFAVFAAFPSIMNSLPKSGGWLNTVKVVLGFAELALAFKFLSNADLVKHWGLLKVEPFLAIWIIVSIGLALYLFGKIRFPHDSPNQKIGINRIVLGLASIAFAVYLSTGLIYNEKAGALNSLKLLSGLAPPSCYSIFYPCDCPQNLNCFKDFEEGMAFARENNKAVMVDFTGHACVNCRKMEEHVWPTKEVYDMLDQDYVLISLYVDEKIDLPEDEQGVWSYSTGGSTKIRLTGQKWNYLQTEFFGNNSQPWYVLLSPDGQLLNQPVGYTPDEKEYAKFLKCGLENFKQLDPGQSKLGEFIQSEGE